MEKQDLIKYPFLDEVRQYANRLGIDIKQLQKVQYRGLFDNVIKRIDCIVKGEKYSLDFDNIDEEILTAMIFRILLSLLGNIRFTKKYALQEAIRIEEFLRKDFNMNDEKIKAIIYKFYKGGITQNGKEYLIPVETYLSHATQFNEKEWKLVNRKVGDGNVLLSMTELIRLLRMEITKNISETIMKMNTSKVPKVFMDYREKIHEMVGDEIFEITGEYPPCIKHALTTLKIGDNLSHSGRVMLATYMFSRGMEIDEIVPFFESAPDYKEKVTRDQLMHLKGETGGRTEYKVPSCSNLLSKGLCYKKYECGNIVNPIQFGSMIKRVK